MSELGAFEYICAECARERGATWPKGHVATMHNDRCDCCGEERALSNVGDWDWPDGLAHGMRD